MKNALFILTLSLSIVACNSTKKMSSEYMYPAESQISLRKGPCFGQCPVFEFSIDGTGTATYNGKKFTDNSGMHAKQFSTEETNSIFKLFESSDFFSFEDEYIANVSDLPGAWISFKHKGQEKEIYAYFKVPQELVDLIASADALTATQGWKPTETE